MSAPRQPPYTYDTARQPDADHAADAARTLSYDNLDRVTKITYSDGGYVGLVYDKDGNLIARDDTVGGNSTYV